jgi:hypothetical protein
LVFEFAVLRNSLFVNGYNNSGPCGGKTSSLNHLRQVLSEKGYSVFTCPEAATFLHDNGTHFPGFSIEEREHLLKFEQELITLEIAMEDALKNLAQIENKPVVILSDRGLIDIRAYVTQDIWDQLLERANLTEASMLQRYDVVCHLVSAAFGAEEFYITSNNQARRETAEEAKALDLATYSSWTAHPALHRIENDGQTFAQKLQNCTDVVVQYLVDHP